MKDALVRFGVAMESSLLKEFDALVEERGATRSEVLRDLARAEVTRAKVSSGTQAVAALTLVYDHHVRDLTERLTDFQHALGEKVNSALHVHLDHDHCLEVIILRGPSDELKRAAGQLIATRGVKHGGIEIIAIDPPAKAKRAKSTPNHSHTHSHDHAHDHSHDDDHAHSDEHDAHAPTASAKRAKKRVTAKKRATAKDTSRR